VHSINCPGHKKIPVCQCRLLPFKRFTWVEMGLRWMFGVGWGQKVFVGKGAVDSQHGTGVEGSLHPCTKGYHLK
jgi:hypothetical protein